MKPTSKIHNEDTNKSINNKEKKIIKKIKGKNATNNILNNVKKNNNLKSKKLHTIEVQLNRHHSEAKKGFIKKLNIKFSKGKVHTQLSQPKIKILLNPTNNNNNNKVIINKNLKNIKRPLSSKLADDKIINKLNQDKSLKANNNKINNIKRLNLKQERNKNKSQDCIIRNIKNPKINNLKKKDNSYCTNTHNKTDNSLSKINISKNVKIKKINTKNVLNSSKGNNKIKNLNNVLNNKKAINNKKSNNDSKISKISKNKTNSNMKKIPINKEAINNKKIPKNKKKFNSKNISAKNFIKKDQNSKKEKSIKPKNNINKKEKEVKSNDKIIKENSNNINNEQKENNTNSDLKPNIEKVDNNTNNNKANDFHKILEISKKECELCHKKIVSHLYKIHYNTHASEIFPWLYLGSFNNACDIEELERIKATHVLNCAYECNNENLPKDIKVLHLKIYDYEAFDISSFFEKANDFINQCKSENGIVFVHCKLGVSRSAALVLAYLIKNMGYTVDSALQLLVQKRDRVNPNKGFMKQLYSYEKLNQEKKIENEIEKPKVETDKN